MGVSKQASLCSKDCVYESQHESMGFANSERIQPKYNFHMRKCGLCADSMKEHDTAKLAPAERKQWGGWINTAGEGKEARAQQEFTSSRQDSTGLGCSLEWSWGLFSLGKGSFPTYKALQKLEAACPEIWPLLSQRAVRPSACQSF